MSAVAETKRTGRGLNEFLKRYWRKANDLRLDRRNDHAFRKLRRELWNDRFEQYQVHAPDSYPDPVPAGPRIPPRLWEELQQEFRADPSLEEETGARLALVHWREIIASLNNAYWPEEDFPSLLRYWGPLSGEFLAACVLYGPANLPEDVSMFFPTRHQIFWMMCMESIERETRICLPIHPEMNKVDLTYFADTFLDPIREGQFDKTASYRINELRQQGYGLTTIARRLGFSESTVKEQPG